jgi:hypothetical protein
MVITIGHPLARSVLSEVVDDDPRVRAWFDSELSKIIAEATMPQPAFINPAL